jgi:hypothetical protein
VAGVVGSYPVSNYGLDVAMSFQNRELSEQGLQGLPGLFLCGDQAWEFPGMISTALSQSAPAF